MTDEIENPFRITKSNNLTDEQIDTLWVTPDSHEETDSFFRPTSQMAMFILGGKGSGKSHLMRYYGFPLQRIRFKRNGLSVLSGIEHDKYIGLYSLCKGMDAHRFRGKGQPQEKWDDLFAYYFELWVADKTLQFLEELQEEGNLPDEQNNKIAINFAELFDVPIPPITTIAEARSFLGRIRKEVDFSVNNVTMTGRLEIRILVSRGRLLFRFPVLIADAIPALSNVVFVYLLDEFENFDERQQTYINTLIREKEGPTSFKIGARLYGFRTANTLSGGEQNREGSEYEVRRLDERYRRDGKVYREFSAKLVVRRLQASSYAAIRLPAEEELDSLFETEDLGFDSETFKDLFRENRARRHHINLRDKLLRGIREKLVVGASDEADIDRIIARVSFPDHPLLEKLCILYLFQQWPRGADLLKSSEVVHDAAVEYLNGARGTRFAEFFNKHKGDMVAQLLRENGRPQVYAGLSTFIRQSEGLPRALITILKHTFDWAAYTQERPITEGPFSIRSQQRGATDAATWFLDEMLMEGEDGVLVQSAVHRLAQLFRANRFADKPIETSMIAFSVDPLRLSADARRILQLAIRTSLIVDIAGGQRERNSEEVTSKLELNTMLSPRYDLPVARRGVASLTPDDVNTIFTYAAHKEFDDLLKAWSQRMTAPFFGRNRADRTSDEGPTQPNLFE